MAKSKCNEPDCNLGCIAKGKCHKHYTKWRKSIAVLDIPESMFPLLRHRLLSRVEVAQAGCLEWQGSRMPAGYGEINVDQKVRRTHRLAYQVFVGPIEPGAMVRHTCDNPPCINPAHLLLGTAGDNAQDAVDRQRNARGTDHYLAKLDDSRVRQMRLLYEYGITYSQLARSFEVSRATAKSAIQRVTWKHVR